MHEDNGSIRGIMGQIGGKGHFGVVTLGSTGPYSFLIKVNIPFSHKVPVDNGEKLFNFYGGGGDT